MVSVCDALAYVKSVSKFQMVLCMPKCAFCAQMVLTWSRTDVNHVLPAAPTASALPTTALSANQAPLFSMAAVCNVSQLSLFAWLVQPTTLL